MIILLIYLNPVLKLFEIQWAQNLRRRSMGFLWVESSTLLDVIISLMHSLAKLPWPKKSLTINSLPIPRFSSLALVLPPMPKLSGHQKELLLWFWTLGISIYHVQDLMWPIEAHEILVFVMKCLLLSPLVSRHLLFVNSVCWLALGNMFLRSTNQPMPTRKIRSSLLGCLQSWKFCLCWSICCQHHR